MKQFEEFNEFYHHVEKRVAAGDLSAEERNDLKLRLQTPKIPAKAGKDGFFSHPRRFY